MAQTVAIPESDSPPSDLIKPLDAAKILSCHVATVYRYMDIGKLRAWRRAGRHWLVSEADVRGLLVPFGTHRIPLPESRSAADRRYERAAERLRKKGYPV